MYIESQSNKGVPFTNTRLRISQQRPKHVLKCVKPGKPGVFFRIKPRRFSFLYFFSFFFSFSYQAGIFSQTKPAVKEKPKHVLKCVKPRKSGAFFRIKLGH